MVRYLDVQTAGTAIKFNELVGGKHKKGVHSMVLYYSEGCYFCEDMKDEWEAFEKEAITKNYNVILARVNKDYLDNVTVHKDIMGYPTIVHLVDGIKHIDYQDKRLKDNFMKFLKDINRHSKKKVSSIKDKTKSKSNTKSKSKRKTNTGTKGKDISKRTRNTQNKTKKTKGKGERKSKKKYPIHKIGYLDYLQKYKNK